MEVIFKLLSLKKLITYLISLVTCNIFVAKILQHRETYFTVGCFFQIFFPNVSSKNILQNYLIKVFIQIAQAHKEFKQFMKC